MTTTNTKDLITNTKQEKAPAKSKQPTIKQYIQVYKNEIAKALPSVMTPERFTRIVTTAVSNAPELGECNPVSFIGAMMQAAQLGLEPNTALGQAYLIPYGKNVQFQLGYKGLIDLAYRSGEVRMIMAQIVYENDEFEFEYGLEPKLYHKPAKENRGKPEWVYAVLKLVNGGEGFEVMSIEDVENFGRKYSKKLGWKLKLWRLALRRMVISVVSNLASESSFTTIRKTGGLGVAAVIRHQLVILVVLIRKSFMTLVKIYKTFRNTDKRTQRLMVHVSWRLVIKSLCNISAMMMVLSLSWRKRM